jgi:hypothetical protein
VEVHGDYLYIPQVSIEYYYQVYVEQHKWFEYIEDLAKKNVELSIRRMY